MLSVKTYIYNLVGNRGRGSEETATGSPPSWTLLIGVCLGLIILLGIAAVVVLSLISLYLPEKNDDSTVSNIATLRRLNLVFASNAITTDYEALPITNNGALSQQINQYVQYSTDILSVESAFLSASAMATSTTNKKKRQLGSAISCDAEINGTTNSIKIGNKLVITVLINKCPKTKCRTDYCVQKCADGTKTEIKSKLSFTSLAFTIQTGDGTLSSISTQFCGSGQVVSVVTCNDGVFNQNETSKDCGGICVSQNKTCANGLGCRVSSDCTSSVCIDAICQVLTCSDNVRNQNETGIDCGGVCVGKKSCADGLTCTNSLDCKLGWCNGQKICKQGTCYDGELNQDETGIDCGGVCVGKKSCADGLTCTNSLDCKLSWCNGQKICKQGTCYDGELNQDETGIDCGGVCGKKKICVDGLACTDPLDCVGGLCIKGVCRSMPQCNPAATTVAGVSGVAGTNAMSLDFPIGLAIDSSGALYIADRNNNRVQKWIVGQSSGTTVAGQASGLSGTGANSFSAAGAVILDSSENLYVSDTFNHRVQLWLKGATAGTTVAGIGGQGAGLNQLDTPYGLARAASSGALYICEYSNHRVMQYLPGQTSGTIVAGGMGQGTSTNQLNNPFGLYYESTSNSLVISNLGGNNVVRWVIGQSSWTLLAGSTTGLAGATPMLLNGPSSVTLDVAGNMYVVDNGNKRVQFFKTGQTAGVTIAGITGLSGSSANLLNSPRGIQFDSQFDLYVADTGNHRVQKFSCF